VDGFHRFRRNQEGRISKYVISKRRWNRPPAPIAGGTRRLSDGTGSPGGRGTIPTPIENHTNRFAYNKELTLAKKLFLLKEKIIMIIDERIIKVSLPDV